MKEELQERFLEFAVNIIIIGKQLNKSFEGRHVYGQLFRSGTSAGANFEESHSAESTRDFIHKREIVLKELRESLYWLKLLKKAQIVTNIELVEKLLIENEELIKIGAKSISTLKNKQKPK